MCRDVLEPRYNGLLKHEQAVCDKVLLIWLSQGPLITDGRKSSEMFIFPIDLW